MSRKLLLRDFSSKPLFKVGSVTNFLFSFRGNSEIIVDRKLINFLIINYPNKIRNITTKCLGLWSVLLSQKTELMSGKSDS